MPDLDVNELARALEKTTVNLKRHIAAEAQKRAAELGKVYAKAADERIRDNEVDLQRAQDVVRKLRRQMKPLTRHTYAHCELEKRLHALVRNAKNRDEGVPPDALLAAMNEARSVAQARWEQEQADAKRQQELAGG